MPNSPLGSISTPKLAKKRMIGPLGAISVEYDVTNAIPEIIAGKKKTIRKKL